MPIPLLRLALVAATGGRAGPQDLVRLPPERARQLADKWERTLDEIEQIEAASPLHARLRDRADMQLIRQRVAELRAGRLIARTLGPLPAPPEPTAQLRERLLDRLVEGYERELEVNDRVLEAMAARGDDPVTVDFLRQRGLRLRAELERLRDGDLKPVMPIEPRGGRPAPPRRID